jgi:hypothetical protein
METLIIVIVLCLVGVAIVICVAFSRGWFSLASVPTENKIQFVLMRKKETVQQEAKKAPVNAESSGLKHPQPPSPNTASL